MNLFPNFTINVYNYSYLRYEEEEMKDEHINSTNPIQETIRIPSSRILFREQSSSFPNDNINNTTTTSSHNNGNIRMDISSSRFNSANSVSDISQIRLRNSSTFFPSSSSRTRQPQTTTTQENNLIPGLFSTILTSLLRNTTEIPVVGIQLPYEVRDTSFSTISDIQLFMFDSEPNVSGGGGLNINILNENTQLVIIKPEDIQECSICHQQMQENDIARKINSCHHFFHFSCIDSWFVSHSTCPLCRSDISNPPVASSSL